MAVTRQRKIVFGVGLALASVVEICSAAAASNDTLRLPSAYLDPLKPKQVPHAHLALSNLKDCAFWSVKPDAVVALEVFEERYCPAPLASSAMVASMLSPFLVHPAADATVYATSTADGTTTEFPISVRPIQSLELSVRGLHWRKLSSTNADGFPAVRLFVGSEEVVEVTALDADGNRFSTLDGVSLHWSLQNINEHVAGALQAGEAGILLGGGNPLTAEADQDGNTVGPFTTRSLHIVEERDGEERHRHHRHSYHLSGSEGETLSQFLEQDLGPSPDNHKANETAAAKASAPSVTRAHLTSSALRVNVRESGRHLLCAQVFVPPTSIPPAALSTVGPLPYTCLELRLRQQLAIRPYASASSPLYFAPATHLVVRLFRISHDTAAGVTLGEREEEVPLPSSRFLFMSSNSRVIVAGVHHGICDAAADGGDAKLLIVDMSVRDSTTQQRVHTAASCGEAAGVSFASSQGGTGSGQEEEACSSEELGGVVAPVRVVSPSFSVLWVEPKEPIPQWLAHADMVRERRLGVEVQRQGPPWSPSFECNVDSNDESPDYCYSPALGPDYPSPLPGFTGVLGPSRFESGPASAVSYLTQRARELEPQLTAAHRALPASWLGFSGTQPWPVVSLEEPTPTTSGNRSSPASSPLSLVACYDFDFYSCHAVPSADQMRPVVRIVAGTPYRLHLSLAGENGQRLVMATNVRYQMHVACESGGDAPAMSVSWDPFPHGPSKASVMAATRPQPQHQHQGGHQQHHGSAGGHVPQEEVFNAPTPWVQTFDSSSCNANAAPIVWPQVTGAIVTATLDRQLPKHTNATLRWVGGRLESAPFAPDGSSRRGAQHQPPPAAPRFTVDFKLPMIQHPVNHVTWRSGDPRNDLAVSATVEVSPPLDMLWPIGSVDASGVRKIRIGGDAKGLTDVSMRLRFAGDDEGGATATNQHYYALQPISDYRGNDTDGLRVDASTGTVLATGIQAEALLAVMDPFLPLRGYSALLSVSRPSDIAFSLPQASNARAGHEGLVIECYRGDILVIPVYASDRDGQRYDHCVELGRQFVLKQDDKARAGDSNVEVVSFSGQQHQHNQQQPVPSRGRDEQLAFMIDKAGIPASACGAVVIKAISSTTAESEDQGRLSSLQVQFEDILSPTLRIRVLERPQVIYPVPLIPHGNALGERRRTVGGLDAGLCPAGQRLEQAGQGSEDVLGSAVVFSCVDAITDLGGSHAHRHDAHHSGIVGLAIGASTSVVVTGGFGRPVLHKAAAHKDNESNVTAPAPALYDVCVERCKTGFALPFGAGGCRERHCIDAASLSVLASSASALVLPSFGVSLELSHSFVAEVAAEAGEREHDAGAATSSYANPSQSIGRSPGRGNSAARVEPQSHKVRLPGSTFTLTCNDGVRPTPFGEFLSVSFVPASAATSISALSDASSAALRLVCDRIGGDVALAVKHIDDLNAEALSSPEGLSDFEVAISGTAGATSVAPLVGVRRGQQFVAAARFKGRLHRGTAFLGKPSEREVNWSVENATAAGGVMEPTVSLSEAAVPTVDEISSDDAFTATFEVLEDFLPITEAQHPLALHAIALMLPPGLLHEGTLDPAARRQHVAAAAPPYQPPFIRRHSSLASQREAQQRQTVVTRYLRRERRRGWHMQTGVTSAQSLGEQDVVFSLRGSLARLPEGRLRLRVVDPLSVAALEGKALLLHNSAVETTSGILVSGGCGVAGLAISFRAGGLHKEEGADQSAGLSVSHARISTDPAVSLLVLRPVGPPLVTTSVAGGKAVAAEGKYEVTVRDSCLIIPPDAQRSASLLALQVEVARPAAVHIGATSPYLPLGGTSVLTIDAISPRGLEFPASQLRFMHPRVRVDGQAGAVRVEESWVPCEARAGHEADGPGLTLPHAASAPELSHRCLVPRFLIHGAAVGGSVISVELESCWLTGPSPAQHNCTIIRSNSLRIFVQPPIRVEPKEVTLLPDASVRLNVAAEKGFGEQWEHYLAELEDERHHHRHQRHHWSHDHHHHHHRGRSRSKSAAAAFQSILHLIKFESSNGSVASVAADGLVTARGLGEAWVHISLRSAADTLEFAKQQRVSSSQDDDEDVDQGRCDVIAIPTGYVAGLAHEAECRARQSKRANAGKQRAVEQLLASGGMKVLVRVALPSSVFITTDPHQEGGVESVLGAAKTAAPSTTASSPNVLPIIAMVASGSRKVFVVTAERHSPLSLSSGTYSPTSITVKWRMGAPEELDDTGDYLLPWESQYASNSSDSSFALVHHRQELSAPSTSAVTRNFGGVWAVATQASKAQHFPVHNRLTATLEVTTRLYGTLRFSCSCILAVIPELQLLRPVPISVHPLASYGSIARDSPVDAPDARSSYADIDTSFVAHMLLLPPGARTPLITSLDKAQDWLPPGVRQQVRATVISVAKPSSGQEAIEAPHDVTGRVDTSLSAPAVVSEDSNGTPWLLTRGKKQLPASHDSGSRVLLFLALEEVIDIDPTALTAYQQKDIDFLRRLVAFLPAQSLTIRIVVEPPQQVIFERMLPGLPAPVSGGSSTPLTGAEVEEAGTAERVSGDLVSLTAGSRSLLGALLADGWGRRMSVGIGALCPQSALPCDADALGFHLFSSDHYTAIGTWTWQELPRHDGEGLAEQAVPRSRWRADELFVSLEGVSEGRAVLEVFHDTASIRGDSIDVAVRTIIVPSSSSTSGELPLITGAVVLFTLGRSAHSAALDLADKDPLLASEQLMRAICLEGRQQSFKEAFQDDGEATFVNVWSSSDDTVLSMNASSGCAFALRPGVTKVTVVRAKRPATATQEPSDTSRGTSVTIRVLAPAQLKLTLEPVIIDAEEAPLMPLALPSPKVGGGLALVGPPLLAAKRALPFVGTYQHAAAKPTQGQQGSLHHVVFRISALSSSGNVEAAANVNQAVRFKCSLANASADPGLLVFPIGPGAQDGSVSDTIPTELCNTSPSAVSDLLCYKHWVWPDFGELAEGGMGLDTKQAACTLGSKSLPELDGAPLSSARRSINHALGYLRGASVQERKLRDLALELEDFVTRVSPFDRFCVVVSAASLEQYRPGGMSLPFSTVLARNRWSANGSVKVELQASLTALSNADTKGFVKPQRMETPPLQLSYSSPMAQILPLPLLLCAVTDEGYIISTDPSRRNNNKCFPPSSSSYWRVFSDSRVLEKAQEARLVANHTAVDQPASLLSPLLLKKPEGWVVLTAAAKSIAFAVCLPASGTSVAANDVNVTATFVDPTAESNLDVSVIETSTLLQSRESDSQTTNDEEQEVVRALLSGQATTSTQDSRGAICPHLILIEVRPDVPAFVNAGVSISVQVAGLQQQTTTTIFLAFDDGGGLPLQLSANEQESLDSRTGQPQATTHDTSAGATQPPLPHQVTGDEDASLVPAVRLLFGGPWTWLGGSLVTAGGVAAFFHQFTKQRGTRKEKDQAKKRAVLKSRRMRRTASALPADFARLSTHPLMGGPRDYVAASADGAANLVEGVFTRPSSPDKPVGPGMRRIMTALPSPRSPLGLRGLARNTNQVSAFGGPLPPSTYARMAAASLMERPRLSPSPLLHELKPPATPPPPLQLSSASPPAGATGAASFAALASRHS